MRLSIKYFASMRERMGCAEQELELAVSEISIAQLWDDHLSQGPMPANTLVAVNMEYCDWDSVVKEGDEVAFFPPVTGG